MYIVPLSIYISFFLCLLPVYGLLLSCDSTLTLTSLQVSDGALRCFASLADRFTRRGVDPAPLAKHGLTEELLSRMAAAGGVATGPASSCKPGRISTGGAPSGPDSKLSNQVSTIVSLLSTLCRGSPLVTHVRDPPGALT